LLALRWRDIDWTARRVRVRRNFVRGEFGTPKSKRSSRSVTLADRLAGALDLLHPAHVVARRRRSRRRAPAHGQADRPLEAAQALQGRAACGRGGARSASTTCATRSARCMAARGIPMRALQEMTGHRDFKTTLIY
jgi:integrase